MTPPKKGGGLTVGSLFSGIGGLDLGLERAGMTVVWQSEIDPYASRVLAKQWPDVPNLGDVTQIDWENDGIDYGDGIAHSLHVDLICGGYPCQPFSYAGNRGGDTDPRHLWPRFADALRHLRPRWALLENVPGHLSLGFGRVLGDLAELGYDTEWDSIPAAAVGAPHLRYRVFVVAHAASGGCEDERQSGGTTSALAGSGRDGEPLAHADEVGRRRRPGQFRQGRWAQPTDSGTAVADADCRGLEVISQRDSHAAAGQQPSRRDDFDGRSSADWWAVEPDVGRVAHGVPRRVDRLRTLGNAVVPQVAEWVGRRIMEAA